MSVVINTNTAATIASNNLSASNAMLQKSLNRLSSGSKIVNASDDAGGVAVAARLSAAAKRSSVANANIGSAVSFLQNQDTALKTLGSVLERMSELQSLNGDLTKSVADRANYSTEFNRLNTQVSAIKALKYNGNALFTGQTGVAVNVGENASSTFTTSNMSSALTAVSSLTIGGTVDASYITGGSKSSVTGTAALGATLGATGNVVINGTTVALNTADTAAVVVAKINAAGTNVTASIDTGLKLTANVNSPNLISLDGTDATVLTALKLVGAATVVQGASDTITSAGETAGLGTTGAVYSGAGGNSAQTGLNSAIQAVASARAQNGADQSSLGYYSEIATASKVNFESAVSKIMDVDVAEESTQLARWNTLVQAGTAMIAQANGSTQSALTLLR
jgi:flagellin